MGVPNIKASKMKVFGVFFLLSQDGTLYFELMLKICKTPASFCEPSGLPCLSRRSESEAGKPF
jgi:hypothetical protein